MTAELAQSGKLLLAEVALVGKNGIEGGAAVALAHDESVPVLPVRVAGADIHYVIIQCDEGLKA